MTKRLFIFAAYDKDSIIDDTLLHYLRALSKLGDIVFTMDNDTPKSEMKKLSDIPNILHATAVRHNEYDFGSYKRGYMWAHENKILNKYDWVYLVNDSVYGPLFDPEPTLLDLESRGVDLIGMTDYEDKHTPKHIQSWFIGLSKKIADTSMIYDFMNEIKHRDSKWQIICKYEAGLSRTILQHGFTMSAVFSQDGTQEHIVYQNPKVILEHFIPFIKKQALNNLGVNVYLLPYTSDAFNDMIYANAKRVGIEYPTNEANKNIYKKCFRLTLLSIPFVTIYKRPSGPNVACYKTFLFDKLPIMKIEKRVVSND